MAGKRRVLAVNGLLLSLTVLAAISQCCGFPSVVTLNDSKPPPKAVGANNTNTTPARRDNPPSNVYMTKSDPG